MKKFDITVEEILEILLIVITAIGIYMCGWINGNLHAEKIVRAEMSMEEEVIIDPQIEITEENETEEASEPPIVIEVIEPVEWPKLYSEEDALAIAKTLWGEARGVGEYVTNDGRVISGDAQKAAVVWTILNRYDAGYEDSIVEVCAAPGQFVGYKSSYPVDDGLLDLTYDVLDRWNAEQHGETDVGRTLPNDYFFFRGGSGYNWFRQEFRSTELWDWELGDPYRE